ncbi:hypothetical protein ACFVYR_35885 [Streptomyces sp. NPDC058284]|uniref:hypothetical protein n=1 Tax=unclassified Streptomyces TaxID=2593676 RepID=UPI003665CAB1
MPHHLAPPTTGAALLAEGLGVLAAHQERAERTLSLVPAENLMTPLARLPLIADLYARYLFDEDPNPATGEWRFPSAKTGAWLESGLAVPLLARLIDAEHVNVRPLSGLHAMEMTIAALGGGASGTLACLAPEQGGHYATADVARRLGHRPVYLPVGAGGLDLDALEGFLCEHRPALVYLDQCHVLTALDAAPVADTIRRAGTKTFLHTDISHTLGLVLGGALPNPLDAGAGSISASTHKTFPGPHKGIIATRDPAAAQQVKAVQPQLVSNHQLGAVAALGLSLAAFADQGAAYAHTVITNARALGKHLAQSGWEVAGAEFGYTNTHQLWITTTPHLDAREAAARLYAAGLHVNWLTDLPPPPARAAPGFGRGHLAGPAPGRHVPSRADHDRRPRRHPPGARTR